MGIVYLAEQREPIARRVALKLVKPGMDSREVLRRFEAERQALALRDHPHIARVRDELSVGALPFDPAALSQAGFTEIHRIIREQDPPKPSTRASTLGATADGVLATTGDGSRYVSTPWRPSVKARIDTTGGRAVIRAFAAGFPIEAGRTLLVKDQASATVIARLVLPTVGVSQSFDAGLVAGIFMDTPDVTARWVRTIFSKMGSSSVVSAAFSLDGRRVATWSWDNVVQVWDVATGKAIGPPQGHRDGVAHVTFSPDGTRLASPSWDGSVRVWRIGSTTPQMTLVAHQGEAASVAFTADGARLVAASRDGLRIFGSRSAYRSDVVDLVDRLFADHHLAAAVIDHLRNAAVDSPFRQAAVQMVETRGDDVSALGREARRLVAAPGNSPDDYRRGLQLAQAAVELVRFDQEFLGTLGVAFYRTGRHSEALAILERATALEQQPGTIELAFSAMACRRLGDNEQMRSFLAQLRDHMKDEGSRGEQERAWLAEAEALIAGKPAVANAGRQ
jgi:hypothetical protein